MKKLLLMVLVVVSTAGAGLGQGHERDSVAIFRWRSTIRRAPVLTGASSPRIIVPHERLCFNMEFDLKIATPGKVVEQCMFVNNSTGVIGLLPPHEDGLVNILFPELADFSFQVMGMTGTVYRYHNNKGKNNTIEKWVTTGNSERTPYEQMAGMFTGSVDLQRKNASEPFCNGRMTATAYRFSTNPEMTWYLFGERFPEKLHPRKFLGNMGVGYLYTDEGLYVVAEFRTTGYSCRVTNIEVTNTCLNTAAFVQREETYFNQQAQNITKEKEKLDRAAANVHGTCAGERSALISFKQEQQRKREELLRQARAGNTDQQNSAAQRSLAGMMDPLMVVREDILSAKVDICKAQNSTSTRTRERLGCLTTQLSQLMQLETELQALGARHANEPGRAFAEKSKRYLERKPRGCD